MATIVYCLERTGPRETTTGIYATELRFFQILAFENQTNIQTYMYCSFLAYYPSNGTTIIVFQFTNV